MKNLNLINSRTTGKMIALLLFVVGIVLFLPTDPLFFRIIFIVIIGLSWALTKGKWERNISKSDVQKLRKSKILAIFLILFFAHSLYTSYSYIEKASYDPIELDFNRFYILDIANFLGFIVIVNILFILISIKRKSPKQILLLPLLSILFYLLPGLLVFYGLPFTFVLEYYMHVILSIIQLIWALYVVFVFLRETKQ